MAEQANVRRCLVICPIGSEESDERRHSDQVFKHLIEPAARECGYVAERSSDSEQPGMITSQIITSLTEVSLVVADLSFQNPNVFYELAVRHAARMPVVILCDRKWGLPFDISDARTIRFDFRRTHGPVSGVRQLRRSQGALSCSNQVRRGGRREVDNPVSASIVLIQHAEGNGPRAARCDDSGRYREA